MIIVEHITDLHIKETQMETRVDYLQELRSYMTRILDLCKNTRATLEPGDRLIVLLYGDVFDRALTLLDAVLEWIKFLQELCNYAEIYAVIGNHELTYGRGNLFWFLADNNSSWAELHYPIYTHSSLFKMINIVDELLLEDTLYVMGHYGRPLSHITDEWIDKHYGSSVKRVVLATHNEILDNDILSMFKKKTQRDILYGRERYTEMTAPGKLCPTSRLSHVYVAHMHLAYGKMSVEVECQGVPLRFQLQYLASIGRTNVKEIAEGFYDRVIPQHILNDTRNGIDLQIDDIPFPLVHEAVIVDIVEVTKRREDYYSKAEFRSLQASELEITDPVEDIAAIVKNDEGLSLIYMGLANGEMPLDLIQLLK